MQVCLIACLRCCEGVRKGAMLTVLLSACRMKRKFYSWDEAMNLREVKVSHGGLCRVLPADSLAGTYFHKLCFSTMTSRHSRSIRCCQ